MNVNAIASFLLFFCVTHTFAQQFSNSKWIWSNDISPTHIAPPGTRAFRRYFVPKAEKSLLPCNILIGAHNPYDLFVNGMHIGSGQRALNAQSHSAVLQPGRNVFAIKATGGFNAPSPAGLLVDIQIRYTDGSTEGLVSDPSWHVSTTIPPGFEKPAFDHSSWPLATAVANYGSAPWDKLLSPLIKTAIWKGLKTNEIPPFTIGKFPPVPASPKPILQQEPQPKLPPKPTVVQVTPHPVSEAIPNPKPVSKPASKQVPEPKTVVKPVGKPILKQQSTSNCGPTQKVGPKPKPKPVSPAPCPAKSSKALSLTDSSWIWTNEIKGGNAPIGARAFRKTIAIPHGRVVTGARVLLGVDDHFTFYIQGKQVGTGAVWSAIHNYAVDIKPPAASEVVIAVNAANAEGGPAGLIAAIELELEGCGGSVISITSDGTWKYSTSVPSGFEKPNFNDSKWSSAKIEGKYGMGPWGRLAIPAAVTHATVQL